MIITCVEKIRPGVWFQDGSGRKMMKLQDILPYNFPSRKQTFMRLNPETGEICSDFAINAVDKQGIPCCCPPNELLFYVRSTNDLYPDDIQGPTTKHIDISKLHIRQYKMVDCNSQTERILRVLSNGDHLSASQIINATGRVYY